MKSRIALLMVVGWATITNSGCMMAGVLFDATQRGCWSSSSSSSSSIEQGTADPAVAAAPPRE